VPDANGNGSSATARGGKTADALSVLKGEVR
jgi:hypothetical protein